MEVENDLNSGQSDHILASTEIDQILPNSDSIGLSYAESVDEENGGHGFPPVATQDMDFITQAPQTQLRLQDLLSVGPPESVVSSIDPSSPIEPPAESFMHGTLTTPRQHVSVIIPPSRYTALPYSTAQSGLVYDTRMRFHTELKPIENDYHPEDPSRISSVFQELVDAGLVQDPVDDKYPSLPPDRQLARINCRQATTEEIALVHDLDHIAWVRGLADQHSAELLSMEQTLDSVYLHQQTWLCASLSAGGAIEATKAVVSKQVKNAVAVIRPPGHHAEHDKPGGFCFFDNVAIAAKVCQSDFPNTCRKVLILDWDVHHGNGLQQAFYSDPNVLYISLHVHQNGLFYPNGPYGNHLHCGEEAGLGRNINIPWPSSGMTDADYIYAFQQIVMPVGFEFDPDLVIIAAGFDAAEGDPLGRCHVSPAGYSHMTHMLMQLAQGTLVACLEGGYSLRSIAKSALSMTRTMMGEPPDRLAGDLEPTPAGVDTVQLVLRQQAKFWKCLYPKQASTALPLSVKRDRLHDLIRQWQSKVLWEEYQMSELFILRDRVSKSFEKQVLATPEYYGTAPLLVIFHGPPDAVSQPDPRTSRIELHNTWIADVPKSYIDWAIAQGFGVIDVNIPKHITDAENQEDYSETEPENVRAESTRELATYLWENYIDLNDASHIFVLGIGEACSGLVELLKSNDDCLDRIDCMFSFIGTQNILRRMIREDDDSAAKKYYRHSLVFISPDHPACDAKHKPKRSQGTLVKSIVSDPDEMLVTYRDRITQRMLDDTASWREENNDQQQEEHHTEVQIKVDGPIEDMNKNSNHWEAGFSHSDGTMAVDHPLSLIAFQQIIEKDAQSLHKVFQHTNDSEPANSADTDLTTSMLNSSASETHAKADASDMLASAAEQDRSNSASAATKISYGNAATRSPPPAPHPPHAPLPGSQDPSLASPEADLPVHVQGHTISDGETAQNGDANSSTEHSTRGRMGLKRSYPGK